MNNRENLPKEILKSLTNLYINKAPCCKVVISQLSPLCMFRKRFMRCYVFFCAEQTAIIMMLF
jgi:hypothetical protein